MAQARNTSQVALGLPALKETSLQKAGTGGRSSVRWANECESNERQAVAQSS